MWLKGQYPDSFRSNKEVKSHLSRGKFIFNFFSSNSNLCLLRKHGKSPVSLDLYFAFVYHQEMQTCAHILCSFTASPEILPKFGTSNWHFSHRGFVELRVRFARGQYVSELLTEASKPAGPCYTPHSPAHPSEPQNELQHRQGHTEVSGRGKADYF